jgi:Tfp pilus assembly protein PilO
VEHYAWLINIIVQSVIFGFGVLGMIVYNNQSNKRLEIEMVDMKEEVKKLAQVIVQQAIQTTRLDSLVAQLISVERRVEDMRRGNGWVTKPTRTGIDGEYP